MEAERRERARGRGVKNRAAKGGGAGQGRALPAGRGQVCGEEVIAV